MTQDVIILENVPCALDYDLFKYLLRPFLLFFFWDPYNSNVDALNVFLEVSGTDLISFHPFFFIQIQDRDFCLSVFQIIYSLFCLSYSITDFSQYIFHFSYCIVHLCLFFSSSRSLLDISCIFLIYVSILFPRFWIIFTLMTLNSFSYRLPISSSFSCCCRFLACFFICKYLSVFSFCRSYCVLWSPFCRVKDHSSSCFWRLPPGGVRLFQRLVLLPLWEGVWLVLCDKSLPWILSGASSLPCGFPCPVKGRVCSLVVYLPLSCVSYVQCGMGRIGALLLE